MDIITHGLFALTINKFVCRNELNKKTVLFSSLLPDFGEVFIQRELSTVYGTKIVVYDERTSDISVAANLKVTFIYDILHSLTLPISIFIISFFIVKNKNILLSISIGLVTHIFLDSFTHGKVWALKLFFPLINSRIKILDDFIGNWWDWKPKISLVLLDLPIYCFIIWIVLIILLRYRKKNSSQN